MFRRGRRERVPALRPEGGEVQRPGQGGEHLRGAHHRQPCQEAAAAHGAAGPRVAASVWGGRWQRRRQVGRAAAAPFCAGAPAPRTCR
jgi:hypothetical protein